MKRSLSFLSFAVILTLGLLAGEQAAGAKEQKQLTFSKDVAPIFNARCTECHRPGESAPFSTLTYKDVRPWAKSIREKVSNRTMPPWHADPHFSQFKNDRTLTQAEIDTILAWVDQGAKEGNPADLPAAPTYTAGWNIGKPDLVLKVPEYAYKGGADEYQYFDVPTNFTQDMYVQLAEARPGNRKIVHHIIAFIVAPGSPNLSKVSDEQLKNSPLVRDGQLLRMRADQPVTDDACGDSARRGGGGDSILTGYAPGRNADVFEPGTGRKVPAGAIIRFQMHYSNQLLGTSSVEKDASEIGLIFSKEPPARLVTTNSVGNLFFKIPAGAENHKVTACKTLKRDMTLYGMLPHMHLRGKSMQYDVIFPDGKKETILSVPKYDFSWQTNYLLVKPRRIPAGSTLMVTAYFDNSKNNKFNPDPSKDIRYGEPTYDEMMLGFMDYVTENPALAAIPTSVLDSYTGKYEVMPNVYAVVTRDGSSLVVNSLLGKQIFFPQSETRFFVKNSDTDATFVKNETGEVVAVQLDLGGRQMKAKKVKDAVASKE